MLTKLLRMTKTHKFPSLATQVEGESEQEQEDEGDDEGVGRVSHQLLLVQLVSVPGIDSRFVSRE